ncbi:MAG: CsgG/HfaB family protein [bacterium]|nr:CsgG/HfaB family protein [bacterium]
MRNSTFILSTMLLFVLLNVAAALSQNDARTLAILDFSNNSLLEKEKYSSLSPGIAEIMITELSNIQSIKLVERQKINSLMREMELSQSGLISEDKGIQVGKLLGAQFLVMGSYMVSFGEKIRVDMRIVEVETGLTIKAEQVTDKVKNLFGIIKKLNEKITNNLDIKLSKQEQQALKSSEISQDVIEIFSKGLEFEKRGKVDEAKKMYYQTLKKDSNFEPAKKRLQELSK